MTRHKLNLTQLFEGWAGEFTKNDVPESAIDDLEQQIKAIREQEKKIFIGMTEAEAESVLEGTYPSCIYARTSFALDRYRKGKP